MRQEEIPLYDLATTPSYVVAAGGGGDPVYGKPNGIAVIERGQLDEEPAQIFSTEDFIKDIKVYVEDTAYEDFEMEDYSCEESENLDEEKTEALEKAERSGEKEGREEKSEESPTATTETKPAEAPRKRKEIFYMACAGEQYFYLIKYDGGFELLAKEKGEVDQVYFNRHLLLLTKNTILGFYDVVNTYKELSLARAKRVLSDTQEEYFYKLFRRGSNLIYKREGGSSDIPQNWDNFFVYKGSIHKVVFSEGTSTFVFQNQKYSYEGKISRIYVVKEMLVFFINLKSNAQLRFLSTRETLYQLPKITCMHISGDAVVVVTSRGDAIVYINGKYHNKTFLAYLPVTGISMVGKYAFYSVIDGGIGYAKIRHSKYGFEIFLVVLVIAIAIFYGLRKK